MLRKGEILKILKEYEKEYPTDAQLEKNLGLKIREQNYVTKEDLEEIVIWKFWGIEGRKRSNLNRVSKEDDDYIRKVSELAFKTKDDRRRVQLLIRISGVGPAVASVILSFYAPKHYGVFDFHAWQEIFAKSDGPNYTVTNVIKFFEKLREEARKYNLSARKVEKAYFIKHRGRQ